MESSTTMKEKMVENYIMKLDFKDFKKSALTVSQIETGLRLILKENARVEIKYKNDVMVTEENGKSVRRINDDIKSVVVAFIDGYVVDGNGDEIPKVHKYEYVVS